MKKIIISNLLLFTSFVTVGQVYKTERQLSPGVTKSSSILFSKSINGNYYYLDQNSIYKYENGILTKYPDFPPTVNIPVNPTALRDIAEFNGKIYVTSDGTFIINGIQYGVIYFDGTKWQPIPGTNYYNYSYLISTPDFLYLTDVSSILSFDISGNLKTVIGGKRRCYGFSSTHKKNEIICDGDGYIYKYDGNKFDTIKPPGDYFTGTNYAKGSDSDLYFLNQKYLCRIDKNFKLQIIDSSFTIFDRFMEIQNGYIIYYNEFEKWKAYNLKTKSRENIMGLKTNHYSPLRCSNGKIYTHIVESGKPIIYEIPEGVLISGCVYEDVNTNCVKNKNEKTVSQLKINFDKGTQSFLTVTNDTGYYEIGLPSGNYNISIERKFLQSKYKFCGGKDSFNFDTIYKVNIPFNIAPDLKDISSSIIGNLGFLARRGFKQSYTLVYTNYGSSTENITIELEYPEGVAFLSSSSTPQSHSGKKLTFIIPNVEKFRSGKINLEFEIRADNPLNSKIIYICNTFGKNSDVDTTNNTDTLEQRIVAAIDPNFKQSFPEGVVENPVSKIRYHIHFQNEGNYYASKVTVVDTFDGKMPLIKLQMLGTKHPYTMRVEKGNVIIWEFHNINLVPKSESEEGSKGFISFEAPLSRPMVIGETVKNRAHIYFDYEDAITTPFAIVSMGKDPISVKPVFDATHKIKVYPNPTTNGFSINGETKLGEIAIFNTLGKLIYMVNTNNISENINTENWAGGIYFIRFFNNGLTLKVIKL